MDLRNKEKIKAQKEKEEVEMAERKEGGEEISKVGDHAGDDAPRSISQVSEAEATEEKGKGGQHGNTMEKKAPAIIVSGPSLDSGV